LYKPGRKGAMLPEGHPQDVASSTVHLVHVSDIHVTAAELGWKPRDWLSKRLTGWLNLRYLSRGRHFSRADEVMIALSEELGQRPPDHVVFSGDATALGFEAELSRAAELLGVSGEHALPGLAVPGNHDYYTRRVAQTGLFERYFAPWQAGQRIGDERYPFAQKVGHLWLVGVNSSTGNRGPFNAAGRVGTEQLARLQDLLGQLDAGPRILVTHYPVLLANGAPEPGFHGLRDLADLLAVAARGGICLWLHGHRHGAYHHAQIDSAPFPVVCAGSTTERGRWSYGAYTIVGTHFHGVRRRFSPEKRSFVDGETFDLELSSY
jgi:3',5'-cyclic AMP phosphodiesterase CpdA